MNMKAEIGEGDAPINQGIPKMVSKPSEAIGEA